MKILVTGTCHVVNLKRNDIHIRVTPDKQEAYKDAEYVIIFTSTDYGAETNRDDT